MRTKPSEGDRGAAEEGGLEALGERRLSRFAGDARRRCGVRDRREDREAERAADLLGGVDQAAGEARLAFLDAGDGGDRRRHEGEAEPGRGEQRGAEDVGGKLPPTETRLNQSRPTTMKSMPAASTGL